MPRDPYADLDLDALHGTIAGAATDPFHGLANAPALWSTWRRAERWWDAHELPLPAEERDVLRYLAAHDGDAWGHLRTIVRVVRSVHQSRYGIDPCGEGVEAFLRGYGRIWGTAPDPVTALPVAHIVAMLDAADEAFTPYLAARVSLMTVVGYGAWLRGGELVARLATHVPATALVHDGGRRGVAIGPSKGKAPTVVELLLPPELAGRYDQLVADYLAARVDAGIPVQMDDAAPLFVSARTPERSITRGTLAQNLRDLAAQAEVPGRVAAHMLRRSAASNAADLGLCIETLMAQGRWRNVAAAGGYVDVLDPYVPELQVDYPFVSLSPSRAA